MDTAVPYEAIGRTKQKSRTREALVAAAEDLLADGRRATVEAAAQAADVSRTTAYRYFRNEHSLVAAAYPQVDASSLLPDPPPLDVEQRLDIVMDGLVAITTGWEPQLRAALRISLDPQALTDGQALRKGRAIGWIEEALLPLMESHPSVDRNLLAIAIRSATGIESFVWLRDIAGLPQAAATELMKGTARALLAAALRTGVS